VAKESPRLRLEVYSPDDWKSRNIQFDVIDRNVGLAGAGV
jgi:hypothetical protein